MRLFRLNLLSRLFVLALPGADAPGLALATWARRAPVAILLSLLTASTANARMALIVGEPFGSFGTMMPQGHASIYLEDLCVETAVRLRPCRAGEFGAVISRFHDLRHPDLDWLAFPLPVFLYGAGNPADAPARMSAQTEAVLRDSYRRQNLAEFIPDRYDRNGHPHAPPYGDWEEGIGAAFDRRLVIYEFDTTPEQNANLLAWINDRPNRRAYNLGRHNCADFAADLLRVVLPPGIVHRNVVADFDMTTPKQLAREVDTYGRAHPEIHLSVFEVSQVQGTARRSRPIRGAAESLLTTKRYLFALIVLQPEVAVTSLIAYEKRGKWALGLDAVPIAPQAWQPFVPLSAESAAASDPPASPSATD